MQVQIIALLASIYYSFLFYQLYHLRTPGYGFNVHSVRHMRLTVLETRDKASLSTAAHVGLESLDAMLDGCLVFTEGSILHNVDNTTIFRTFPQVTLMNGYRLQTSKEAQTESLDPVRFEVHIANPTPSAGSQLPAHRVPEEQWRLVSAASCRWGLKTLQCLPKPQDNLDLGKPRGEKTDFVSLIIIPNRTHTRSMVTYKVTMLCESLLNAGSATAMVC